MSKEDECTIPNVIYDANTGKSYMKGRFFGKVSEPSPRSPRLLSRTIFARSLLWIRIYTSCSLVASDTCRIRRVEGSM